MKSPLFLDATQCRLVAGKRRFGKTCRVPFSKFKHSKKNAGDCADIYGRVWAVIGSYGK